MLKCIFRQNIFYSPFGLSREEAEFPLGLYCCLCLFWGVSLFYLATMVTRTDRNQKCKILWSLEQEDQRNILNGASDLAINVTKMFLSLWKDFLSLPVLGTENEWKSSQWADKWHLILISFRHSLSAAFTLGTQKGKSHLYG